MKNNEEFETNYSLKDIYVKLLKLNNMDLEKSQERIQYSIDQYQGCACMYYYYDCDTCTQRFEAEKNQ